MSNGNIVERPDMTWRTSLSPNIRYRLVANLIRTGHDGLGDISTPEFDLLRTRGRDSVVEVAMGPEGEITQDLKPLSPGTQEAQLLNVAKNFESSIYGKSNSREEYFTAYSRKAAQIKWQHQLLPTNQETHVAANAIGIGGLVVDNGGVFQQQVQAMANSPQQPVLQSLQPQQTIANMQQTQQQLANQARPQILVAGQQQGPPILSQQQIAARQLINARTIQAQQRQQAMVAAVAGGQHQPQAPMPQQVLQQQVQTAMATLQNLKPGMTNFLLQRQQAAQSSSPATVPQQAPAGMLHQSSRPPTAVPQIGARPKMTLDTAVSPAMATHPSLVPAINSITATGSSVQQKLAMTTQQQFQAQEPNNPAQGMERPPQAGVSHSQHGAAVQLVHSMNKTILANRVKTSELSGLTEEEKVAIREQVTHMKPMFERVDQLLPVFLALTNNHEATKRLMLMKYMFQDQLDALQKNQYVISQANLTKLKEQFSRYFMWVKNQIGGQNQAQTTGASSPDTNAQVLSQQQMIAQRVQQLRQQQAGPLKHAQLDLKLPPAKRQATGPQQSSPATGAARDFGASLPVTVDLTSPVPTTLQSAQNTVPVRPSIPSLLPQQQQQAIQAAIASGLAPQIAASLSREALQAQYVLQQGIAGKAALTPHQKVQLQRLYAHQVTVAKDLVIQQANVKALAATQLQQNSAATGIDQKPMEIQQPAVPTTAPLQATVDSMERNKHIQIQAMARLVQQKQMQVAVHQQQQQQQQQPQPVLVPTIKVEPTDVPTPMAAVATGTVMTPSQLDVKIKEEPGIVEPLVTIKTEPVVAPKSFLSPGATIYEKTNTDPRLHAEDVIKKFVQMHVNESKQNGALSKVPLFPATHVLAPVVEARSGAGYFGDEDCMQENGDANRRPVTVGIKDILRGFKLPDEDTDSEEEMIDSGEVDTDDEKVFFSGKGNLSKEGEAVRREISKLGHDWVLSP